jgi:6,7-dimethyl-8-ribityllumazine synthase
MASKPYLIIASRFNRLISSALHEGALDAFTHHGVGLDLIKTLWVPGCFEIPGLAAKAARSGKFSAIICLGAVIKGDTPHFDYVAGETARGLQQVSIDTGIPVIFGILTTLTEEQALSRCGIKGGNKGAEAAHTAISMTKVYRDLDEIFTHE